LCSRAKWRSKKIYGIPSREVKKRIEELLDIVGLKNKADTKVRILSTNERMKMNIIRGSMTDPKVVFLDELTFCFDVRTSRTIRSFIKNWIKENKDSEIEEIKEFSFSKDNC